jgi:hypothetical protein
VEFRDNLLDGIDHYRRLAEQIDATKRPAFLGELDRLQQVLAAMPL